MKTESAGRILGMYVDMSKQGLANCRPCYVIAFNDGTVVMANASTAAAKATREELPPVTLPGITAEQLETIVATATGTAQPAKGVRS